MRRALVVLLLCAALGGSAAYSRHRHRNTAQTDSQPGQFDYYLLSLSWSPAFCGTHPDAPECGGVKRFGFIVHGLWPQFERGYPKGCTGAAFDPNQLPAGLRDIMPSDPLIQHEWENHGTCSGLPEQQYFKTVENAWSKVTIPAVYKQSGGPVEVSPADVKQNFAKANSSFPPGAFAIECSGNRFLSEVRACMTKDLQPRACSASVHDNCNAATVIMRPLR